MKKNKLVTFIAITGLVLFLIPLGNTLVFGFRDAPLDAVEGGTLQSYEWWYYCPRNPEKCPSPPTPAPLPTPTCIPTVPCPVVTHPSPTPYPTQPPLKPPGEP